MPIKPIINGARYGIAVDIAVPNVVAAVARVPPIEVDNIAEPKVVFAKAPATALPTSTTDNVSAEDRPTLAAISGIMDLSLLCASNNSLLVTNTSFRFAISLLLDEIDSPIDSE